MMTIEIRPYREEEAAAFFRVPSIVFGNYNGLAAGGSYDGDRRSGPSGRCARRGWAIATTYGAFPLIVRLNARRRRWRA